MEKMCCSLSTTDKEAHNSQHCLLTLCVQRQMEKKKKSLKCEMGSFTKLVRMLKTKEKLFWGGTLLGVQIVYSVYCICILYILYVYIVYSVKEGKNILNP